MNQYLTYLWTALFLMPLRVWSPTTLFPTFLFRTSHLSATPCMISLKFLSSLDLFLHTNSNTSRINVIDLTRQGQVALQQPFSSWSISPHPKNPPQKMVLVCIIHAIHCLENTMYDMEASYPRYHSFPRNASRNSQSQTDMSPHHTRLVQNLKHVH